MTETWRKKSYYGPRVLIPVADLTDPPFQDILVCLTGAQLVMLRNLAQYLTYRSTWVSEYHEDYYLAPSSEEWDAIEAAVAELEYTLMGCQDIVTQLACICDALQTLKSDSSPPDIYIDEGQPPFDNYESTVVADEGDPPEGFEDWDEWHDYVCIGAQKVLDDIRDAMENLDLATAAGGAVTFAALQGILIGTTVLPPVQVVVLLVQVLLALGLALLQEEVRVWIDTHKAALVCEIYGSATAAEARSRIASYVEGNWTAAAGPQVFLYLVSKRVVSTIFDGTMPGYATWAGLYLSTYCDDCGADPYYHEYDFVVDTDWAVNPPLSSYAYGKLYCYTNDGRAQSPQKDALPAASYNLTFNVYGQSNVTGITGQLNVQSSDNGVDWTTRKTINLNLANHPNFGWSEVVTTVAWGSYTYQRYEVKGYSSNGSVRIGELLVHWVPTT